MNPNNTVLQTLKRVLWRNKRYTLLLIVCIFGVVLSSLMPPQILKSIIDQNFVPKREAGLLNLAILYLGMIVMIGLFDFFKEAILTVLGQKITREIRHDMMEKMEHIQIGFFSVNGTGAVVSRFINDVEAINSMFTNGIIGMVVDLFRIIGIVVSIWMFNSKLGLLTLMLLPIIYSITRFFQKRMLKAHINNRLLIGRVNNHIGESIKNIQMIKSFSKEDYMEKKYGDILLENFKTVEKVNFYDSVFPPIIQIIRAVVIGGIVLASSQQLNGLGISLGMVAASIDLISNLFTPIEQLGMELQNLQQAISGIYRVNDFFVEQEDEKKDESLQVEKILSNKDGVALEFQNVSFEYEAGNPILTDISIQINPLEKVAFVGRTGVGKTTLFKLVLGLMPPTKGAILVNGVNVYELPNLEKRKIFGYVDQSFKLVKGTVAEQITLMDIEITTEQVNKALEFVGLLDYVQGLSQGIETPVTGEQLFSQGQKQLLSIARAIVLSPQILLLDEITANLDAMTEEKIMSVLQKASSNHMVLSISHRLSSIVASEKIVILEEGKVKNVGTPEELLQMDDWYQKEWAVETTK